jgi:hypothetical protein
MELTLKGYGKSYEDSVWLKLRNNNCDFSLLRDLVYFSEVEQIIRNGLSST